MCSNGSGMVPYSDPPAGHCGTAHHHAGTHPLQSQQSFQQPMPSQHVPAAPARGHLPSGGLYSCQSQGSAMNLSLANLIKPQQGGQGGVSGGGGQNQMAAAAGGPGHQAGTGDGGLRGRSESSGLAAGMSGVSNYGACGSAGPGGAYGGVPRPPTSGNVLPPPADATIALNNLHRANSSQGPGAQQRPPHYHPSAPQQQQQNPNLTAAQHAHSSFLQAAPSAAAAAAATIAEVQRWFRSSRGKVKVVPAAVQSEGAPQAAARQQHHSILLVSTRRRMRIRWMLCSRESEQRETATAAKYPTAAATAPQPGAGAGTAQTAQQQGQGQQRQNRAAPECRSVEYSSDLLISRQWIPNTSCRAEVSGCNCQRSKPTKRGRDWQSKLSTGRPPRSRIHSEYCSEEGVRIWLSICLRESDHGIWCRTAATRSSQQHGQCRIHLSCIALGVDLRENARRGRR